MEMPRAFMSNYLLSFCRSYKEYDEQEARLAALTDEALREEFTAEYNAMQGARPEHPLYEEKPDDLNCYNHMEY